MGEYQPLVWQIVTDDFGFQALHETNEDGGAGDLIALIYNDDHSALLLNAPRLLLALGQLIAIAGTPITARQEAVFAEARAALALARNTPERDA